MLVVCHNVSTWAFKAALTWTYANLKTKAGAWRKKDEKLLYPWVAVANTDGNNASEKVQIAVALIVPEPLHRSLGYVQGLFVIGQVTRI